MSAKQMVENFENMTATELAEIWKSNDRSAWSDDAFEAVGIVLRGRGVDPGPQDEGKTVADAERELLHSEGVGRELTKLWRGEESLASTYWIFGMVGTGIFKGVLYLTQGLVAVNIAILALAIIYAAFVYVAIWRSAIHYQGPRLWSVLARVMVVIGAAWLALSRIFI